MSRVIMGWIWWCEGREIEETVAAAVGMGESRAEQSESDREREGRRPSRLTTAN